MPFTTAQFIDVFRRYNEAVWPAQWLLNATAVAATVLAIRDTRRAGHAVAILLAVLWIWMGVVYHLLFFASINRAAIAFAVLFVLEGLVLLTLGLANRIRFRLRWNIDGAVGLLFVLYALAIYPAIGLSLGHRYPAAPTFGLPCPTTIFTFGLLLWVDGKAPMRLLVIPAIWTLIGSSAAWSMGMVEDYGLLIAGILSVALPLFNRQGRPARSQSGSPLWTRATPESPAPRTPLAHAPPRPR
jgi:hypothetical protein